MLGACQELEEYGPPLITADGRTFVFVTGPAVGDGGANYVPDLGLQLRKPQGCPMVCRGDR